MLFQMYYFFILSNLLGKCLFFNSFTFNPIDIQLISIIAFFKFFSKHSLEKSVFWTVFLLSFDPIPAVDLYFYPF